MHTVSSSAKFLGLNAPIQRRAGVTFAPLTDRQEDWWIVTSKEGRAVNPRLRAASVRILGPLDVDLLRTSISFVVERHESLRTRVLLQNDTPVQVVDSPPPDPIEVVHLRAASAAAESQCRSHAKEFFDQKVDLSTGPLLAIQLLVLSPTAHVLLIGLEHSVADGTSCAILNREIWATYNQMSAGVKQVTLPPLPIQLSDYAIWQRENLALHRQLHEAFWVDRMRNSPQIALPQHAAGADSNQLPGGIIHLPFGKSLSEQLRALSRREKTLAPLIFLTVYLLALSRWCGQEDFVTIVAHHGRYRRLELENLIGYLAKALYFRVPVTPTETLSDLVARVHGEFITVTSNEVFTLPFPKDCNLSFLFNWGGLSTYSARWSIDQQRRAERTLRIQPFDFQQITTATFFPFFSETPSGVVLTVYFRPDRVSRAVLERLARNLRFYGAALVNSGRTTIGSLPFVD